MQGRTKEVPVRKVVAVELVSVNDVMVEANAAGMAASDALLLGRVTFVVLASLEEPLE